MSDSPVSRRLRVAMVGGGQGAFIGAVHRMALRLDDRFELLAGVFSSQPERNRQSARELHIAPERCYADVAALIDGEAGREDGVEALIIVTPNHLHFDAALEGLEAGLHVVCEKPMTLTAAEAERLKAAAAQSAGRFLLTHTYAGYPMIQHARELIAKGELGALRHVQVEYVQEWLSVAQNEDNRQAAWRTDPAKAGAAGCLGDIGVHAFQLAQFVTGQKVAGVSASLSTAVAGRALDDSVQALLRFENGASGMLWASQCAPGFENELTLRIVGEKASLQWAQESPNALWLKPLDAPSQRLTRRSDAVSESVARSIRLPGGHPEGYIESFANLYQGFADQVQGGAQTWLPGIEDGVDGMRFIEAAIASSDSDGAWTALDGEGGRDG
ncbi:MULTISPECIES: Gfo/Idh/MocA family protein [unclassified Halomonas]|uniref:Gfo/Idh/MocA family protein n=1 Tax=unclassified Halomonas TaxID=2609666 RepID=UPI00209DA77A|nr:MULTISPECIES: Gfo/Idh/MocA family oxidoreductase [unclassified Halomonas]MCP1313667.1 Gfo/Idh/MocA family oxidoreductase [Halomonas sp. 707D7]MCP1326397.1 Gfo/Idh/MocA family oxidoreductase [Halomonas sp. 707D4]